MSDTRSDDNEDEIDERSEPIMSLFASYYGIEDTSESVNVVKGTIDDVDFSATSYVEVNSISNYNQVALTHKVSHRNY